MSGVGFSEFLILCLIGLIVLGPRRLPRVANQIGRWVGQARRMTRVMRRQLEEELNFDEDLNIKPPSHPPPMADEPADNSDVGASATGSQADKDDDERPETD